MDNFLLLTLALAPGLAIILFIYFKDKYEAEPIGLLIKSFVFGLLSVVVTLIISYPLQSLFALEKTNWVHQLVSAFFMVALVEEFSKYVFVRGILYRDKNFNEPFDGIVYSIMVGMGFATAENILYVFQGGAGTAFMRMFTAVPAHGTFAVIMGYYLGKAKFTEGSGLRFSIVALVMATLVHGFYDYFLFISFVPGVWVLTLACLVIAILVSRSAIKSHQDISPFAKKRIKGTDEP